MTTENILYPDLKIVKDLLYDKCGFELIKLKLNSESVEYSACSFELNGKRVVYRVSKITPKKTGQFVAIWKRNKNGETEPFHILNDIDFMVITSIYENRIGQFVFPKSVLADKRIIRQNETDGKRGIRVYPTWDTVTNKQAEKTQNWQKEYFIEIKSDGITNIELTKKLFNETITS